MDLLMCLLKMISSSEKLPGKTVNARKLIKINIVRRGCMGCCYFSLPSSPPLDTDCAWCLHQERLSSVCKYFVVYKLQTFSLQSLGTTLGGGMRRVVVRYFTDNVCLSVCLEDRHLSHGTISILCHHEINRSFAIHICIMRRDEEDEIYFKCLHRRCRY